MVLEDLLGKLGQRVARSKLDKHAGSLRVHVLDLLDEAHGRCDVARQDLAHRALVDRVGLGRDVREHLGLAGRLHLGGRQQLHKVVRRALHVRGVVRVGHRQGNDLEALRLEQGRLALDLGRAAGDDHLARGVAVRDPDARHGDGDVEGPVADDGGHAAVA